MNTLLESLSAWSPMIGVGLGIVWLVIALLKKYPMLAILALILCALAGQIAWLPTLLVGALFGWMVLAEPPFLRAMASNFTVVGELMSFLWERKLWWLIPMVTVLLVFGLLMIFATASGIGPFIYTLF